MQSWSQFDPGNWTTANFIGVASVRSSVALWDHLEPVIFDHRIGQKIAGNFMQFCFVRGTRELDFNALSDPDTADIFESEMFHGFGGGGALRVEH
jgi:hypothetical protein